MTSYLIRGRQTKWDTQHQPRSSLEAAAEAAAKVNAMLIAKGKLKPSQLSQQPLPKPKASQPSQSNLVVAEVDINDVPIQCRNMLTRGCTQDEISKMSGAAVSTRGRYMSPEDRAKNNMGERPLYLCIQGGSQDNVNVAVSRVKDLINQGVQKTPNKVSRFSKLPPGFQPNIPPPILPDMSKPPSLSVPPPLMSLNPQPTRMSFAQEKVLVGLEHAPPSFDVKGKVTGPGGSFLHHIMNETGAKLALRGKGSGLIETMSGREAMEALHVHVTHPSIVGLQQAVALIRNLIETVQQEYAQFQHILATLPPQVNHGTATLLAGLQHHNSQPPPGIIAGLRQQVTLPPPGVNLPHSLHQLGPLPGLMRNSLPSSLPVSITSSQATNLVLTTAPPGFVSTTSAQPSMHVISTQPAAMSIGQSDSMRPDLGQQGLVPNMSQPPPGYFPVSAPSSQALIPCSIAVSGLPSGVTTVYTISQPGQLSQAPSPGLHQNSLQTLPPNLQPTIVLSQNAQQPLIPGQPITHITQGGQLLVQSQGPPPGTVTGEQMLARATSQPAQILPGHQNIVTHSSQQFLQSLPQPHLAQLPGQMVEQGLSQSLTCLPSSMLPPGSSSMLPPGSSSMLPPGSSSMLPPGLTNQPGLHSSLLSPGAISQPGLPSSLLHPGAIKQPGLPSSLLHAGATSQPGQQIHQPSSVSMSSSAPYSVQSAIPGQPAYTLSTIPSRYDPTTSAASQLLPVSPTVPHPEAQTHKRRFTEEKQEDRLPPEGLLGYQHGPPHIANLVTPRPPPPPPSVQQTPSDYGPPPPPPPPDENRSSHHFQRNDCVLMPPPPPPPSGTLEGDRHLMPPPPGEPDRKRLKGVLRGMTAYGSDEEEDGDVNSSMKQHQRDAAKYSFNQYSGKPHLYGHPMAFQEFQQRSPPSSYEQYQDQYMQPPQQPFHPPPQGAPFWMAPN